MMKTYVIGLSQLHLLDIRWKLDPMDGAIKVSRITHGPMSIQYARLFDDLRDASDTVKEIQDRYGKITVRRDNVVESLVHGNDFDPTQLHIYEVRVGWEVK